MHTQSESLNELFQALAKAQGEFPDIDKGRVAKTPKYSYRYADLADVLKAIRPILSKNGLSLIQYPEVIEGKQYLVTRLGHSSGQWLSGRMEMPYIADDPQTMGSLYTYFRRYEACAMVGVAAEEDDDASQAQNLAATQKAIRVQDKLMPSSDSQATPLNAEKGEYIIRIGKKYAGMKLSQVAPEELKSYANYFTETAQKTGKPNSPEILEAVEQIRAYLGE